MANGARLTVCSSEDVYSARRRAREVVAGGGFDGDFVEAVAVAVSELATNLVRYAPGGEIAVERVVERGRAGVRVESTDAGPGIADLDLALSEGCSSGGGLGLGFATIRHVMDSLDVASNSNGTRTGTRIVAYKWLPQSSS
ncbi:MAG: ATP-binding protein [Chloroflexota bacterium]